MKRAIPESHRLLVVKTDAFDESVRARRAADMKCKAGCSSCCVVQLTVCDVEADLLREGIDQLDDHAHAELQRRAARLKTRGEDLPLDTPCVFLDDDGRCVVYPFRPLVCRTQGLPLRYPPGVLAAEQVFGETKDGSGLTWCPLNFTDRAPEALDILDAQRLDLMLALSNRGAGGDPERRHSMVDVVQTSAESNDETVSH